MLSAGLFVQKKHKPKMLFATVAGGANAKGGERKEQEQPTENAATVAHNSDQSGYCQVQEAAAWKVP